MPGYGVPEDTTGLLDWQWASDRLERTHNYWVVTASPDGRPHALPVWGVWLAERCEFVFSCDPQSRKARNLRANPRIVVAADDTIEVVSVEGTATEVATSSIPDIIERLAFKYEPDPDKGMELIGFLLDTCGFRVRPERAFGMIERPEEFSARATKWVWEG